MTTKDDIINFQDRTLDNIEAFLNLKVGSVIKNDKGETYRIAKDLKSNEIYLVLDGKFIYSRTNNINNYIVAFLQDNFLGNNDWVVVE